MDNQDPVDDSPDAGQPTSFRHLLVGATVVILSGVLLFSWLLDSPGSLQESNTPQALAEGDEIWRSQIQAPKELQVAAEPVPKVEVAATATVAVQSDPLQSVDLRSSAPDAGVGLSVPEPLPNAAIASVEAKPAAEPTVAVKAEPKPKPKPVAVPTPKPKSEPAPKPVVSTSPKNGDWLIQVGAFTNTEARNSLVAQLSSNRFGVLTDQISISGKAVSRVMVGPYPSRAAANGEVARVKSVTGLDPLVRQQR
ncbi:SPOR domain-containing protein [Gammaproteobacteria bacterium]|nr:SPOR domain-containing protein [Gammaproteobacteria bacterium]